MGVKKQEKFTKEFKLNAIDLADKLGSAQEAATKLGINIKNIYNWKSQYKKEGELAFPGKGKLNEQDAKLHALEAENKRLKMELEFLKKAASYFASHQK